MPGVKTVKVATSAGGTVEPPITDVAPVADAPAPGSVPEVPAAITTPNPGTVTAPEPAVPAGASRPLVEGDLPPNRPGLETPAPAPFPADPFQTLNKFASGETYRTLAAMPVPGGCLVRLASVRGSNFSDSIAFVPGVVIDGEKLYPAPPSTP